jgi:hypothetical protein
MQVAMTAPQQHLGISPWVSCFSMTRAVDGRSANAQAVLEEVAHFSSTALSCKAVEQLGFHETEKEIQNLILKKLSMQTCDLHVLYFLQ